MSSKRKWVVDGCLIVGDVRDETKYDGEEGVVVADCQPDSTYITPSEKEQRANAKRIVHCVNNFDALQDENKNLIESLKDTVILLEGIVRNSNSDLYNNLYLTPVIDKAKKLIDNN